MKREVERIRDQLQRAYGGEAWHGPSLRELLAGVGAKIASARPVPGAHSIWELVLHVVAWQQEAVARLKGEERDLPAEKDWPGPGKGEDAWGALLRDLERTHQELSEAVAELDDVALDAKVEGRRESIYVLLHGIVQHNLYHAGQIALLKKAATTPS